MTARSGILRAEARIDLDAIKANVVALRGWAPGAEVMAVVKADAYGHGLVPCARAALAGGATWLGTALLDEALALRAAGAGGRILAWLAIPGEPAYADAITADIDLSANATWAIDEIAAAARAAGRTARVHLKVDTGLSRGGATVTDWPELVDAAVRAEADATITVVGLWTHFAWADAPGHPMIARQLEVFTDAVAIAEKAGLRPGVRHVANSAATLTLPGAHFDLVRPGIAVFGIAPMDERAPGDFGLRPAMTLIGRLALVKRVAAGSGVSYGHERVLDRDTTLGLVPLGYADGIPRHAGNRAQVLAGGRRRDVAGRVCMDQFVVDFADDEPAAGDEVVLFGPGDDGAPLAADWARAAGTIAYEIVTRIGPRVPRVYVGGDPAWTR